MAEWIAMNSQQLLIYVIGFWIVLSLPAIGLIAMASDPKDERSAAYKEILKKSSAFRVYAVSLGIAGPIILIAWVLCLLLNF